MIGSLKFMFNCVVCFVVFWLYKIFVMIKLVIVFVIVNKDKCICNFWLLNRKIFKRLIIVVVMKVVDKVVWFKMLYFWFVNRVDVVIGLVVEVKGRLNKLSKVIVVSSKKID